MQSGELGRVDAQQLRHHTISRSSALAALPSVIGGPGRDFP
jgi:hypothetical protein